MLQAVFADLSPEQRGKLEDLAQEVFLKKGEQLFGPGDRSRGFYVVLEGVIRVYGMSSQGKEITQEIAGELSAFALASPFSGTYQCFAEALKDSRLYLIKKTGIFRPGNRRPRLRGRMDAPVVPHGYSSPPASGRPDPQGPQGENRRLPRAPGRNAKFPVHCSPCAAKRIGHLSWE